MRRLGLGATAALACAVAAAGIFATGSAGAQTAPAAQQPTVQGVAVNLNITPKRLVLRRGTNAGSVYIFNQGNVPATFDISLVERVMLPNGEIKSVAEARAQAGLQPIIDKLVSAQSLLVATPRRVTLAPGKGQTVRIRATQPPGTTGEYRTHLTVTTVPPREAGITADRAQSAGSREVTARVDSIFGLTIPVIIRPGAVDLRGAIENPRIDYAEIPTGGAAPTVRTPVLRFELRRVGVNSLFGNVEVKSSRGRNVLGLARGIGVYPEIDTRTIQIPLRRVPTPGEQLEVIFTDDDVRPGQVIARSTITAS